MTRIINNFIKSVFSQNKELLMILYVLSFKSTFQLKKTLTNSANNSSSALNIYIWRRPYQKLTLGVRSFVFYISAKIFPLGSAR